MENKGNHIVCIALHRTLRAMAMMSLTILDHTVLPAT